MPLHPPLSRSHRQLIAIVAAAAQVAAASSLIVGCSRQDVNSRTIPVTADTLENGLRRSDLSRIDDWTTMWRAAIPGFRVDSLRLADRGAALRGGSVQPMADFESLSPEERAAFEVLSERAPDGGLRLVFDRYQSIQEDAGVVEIGGEPDSAPLLIDELAGRAHVFETCGTPCGFDWGCWFDTTRFALGGWAQVDDLGDSLSGVLDIYSLADSTKIRYLTRPVSRDDYANYREAWRNWVTARFRDWKLGTASVRH